MTVSSHTIQIRVRYYEIDRMNTFYNSRALEWFERGRVELLRAMNLPYDRMEEQGFHLPLIEAHVEYAGRAAFDDLLEMTTTVAMVGKARVRFDMTVRRAADPDKATDPPPSAEVVRGYTIHAITDRDGRPLRPPPWLLERIAT